MFVQEEKRQGDAPLAVLMISPQFRPLLGGYERAAERLSAALAEVGLRVVVITERRERAWPVVERIEGYEVRRLSCWYRRHLHASTSLLSFASFLLRHGRDFDVWHIHQYGYHAALAVALGTVLCRPVVLKLTSSAGMGIEKALGSGIVGGILGFFHRRASAYLAVSEETREEAIRFSIPARCVHLIPNGVDGRQFYPATSDERAAARRALGLNCERLMLYVGRLSAEKNPIGLLDAWAAIDAKVRAGALLALVGNGPDWDKLHAKVQMLDLTGSVHLAGQRNDVATWYRAADVYVISSHNEGLSNSMIEAMACGLPVVATAVSGIKKYVGRTNAGLVVGIGDMKGLAGAMEVMMTDSNKREFYGRASRKVFDDCLSLAEVANQMNGIYRSIERSEV
jgi:glycosyltransferase involved in cell wall biosynthesis